MDTWLAREAMAEGAAAVQPSFDVATTQASRELTTAQPSVDGPITTPASSELSERPSPDESAAAQTLSTTEPLGDVTSAPITSPEAVDAIIDALSRAKKVARNTAWQPIAAGAEGWSIRWKKRGNSAQGDSYWQTPTGEEVRSMKEARGWLEHGTVNPKIYKRAKDHDEQPHEPLLPPFAERTPRASLLVAPIEAGNSATLEALLQRHGSALLQPGILQKAILKPQVLEILLRHLPSDAANGGSDNDVARRQRVLDGLDEHGHSALSLACYDRAPDAPGVRFDPDETLPAARLLLGAGATIDLAVRDGRSKALNEACAYDPSLRHRPRTALIELLLEARADVERGTCVGGWTALQVRKHTLCTDGCMYRMAVCAFATLLRDGHPRSPH